MSRYLKLLLAFVVYVWPTSTAQFVNHHFNYKEDKYAQALNSVGTMVKEMVERYFCKSRCIVLIREKNDHVLHYQQSQTPLFNINLPRNTSAKGVLPATTSKYGAINMDDIWRSKTPSFYDILLFTFNTACDGYIVQVCNHGYFATVFSELTKKAVPRTRRKYLFLPHLGEMCNEDHSKHEEVLHMKEARLMPNLVVAKFMCFRESNKVEDALGNCSSGSVGQIKSRESVFKYLRDSSCKARMNENISLVELYTHSFPRSTVGQEVLLDMWLINCSMFVMGNWLFPSKVADLKGRPLTVTSSSYMPYTFIDEHSMPAVYDGLDFMFVKELVRLLNASLVVKDDGGYLWGKIYENATGVGQLGQVVADQVDLAICCLFLLPQPYRFVDFSIPYTYNYVMCLAPKPGFVPKWIAIVKPFTWETWLAVGSLMVAGTFCAYATRKICSMCLGQGNASQRFATLGDSAMLMCGMLFSNHLLEHGDPRAPQNVPMRHLLVWFTVVFLVVSSSYSGGLASILTVPQQLPAIRTVKNLADSGIEWAGVTDIYLEAMNESDDPIYRTLISKFRLMTEEQMRNATISRQKLAFVVDKLVSGHFSVGTHITGESTKSLRLMEEELYWVQCAFAFSKGSPLGRPVNRLISRASEAGLFAFWEDEVFRRRVNASEQLAIVASKADPVRRPVQLTLHHAQGAFLALGMGVLASAVAFLAETVRHKHRHPPRTAFHTWQHIVN